MDFITKFLLISVFTFLFFYFKSAARKPLNHWYANVGWRFKYPKFVEPSRAALEQQRLLCVFAMIFCVGVVIVVVMLPSDGDVKRERERRFSMPPSAPSAFSPRTEDWIRDRYPHLTPVPSVRQTGAAGKTGAGSAPLRIGATESRDTTRAANTLYAIPSPAATPAPNVNVHGELPREFGRRD